MVFIRADANKHVGSGHIMRCLSIAQAIVQKGTPVKFITADHNGDELIHQKGFSSCCLETEWANMLDELPKLLEMIKNEEPTFFLIDSYYVTEEYLHCLSEVVRTIYIDDLNKVKTNVDTLINYNIFASVYDYTRFDNTKTRLLLYPRYAPLREEFKNALPHVINSDVTDILVSAGGSDPERISEKIMKMICPAYEMIRFHFVIGILNPFIEKLKELEKNNIILHIDERNMSDLMKDCDIAISAAGSTLYELCACGLPTITYTLADNQQIAAEQFMKKDIMLYAGDCRNNNFFLKSLCDCIDDLKTDERKRQRLSQKMQNLVDGYGAERIAEELLCKPMK